MVFVSLSCTTPLGKSGEHRNCSKWVGKCTKCAKKITWTQGIFCVNFCVSREGYPPCQGSSCGQCFSLEGKTSFPIKREEYKTNENTNSRDVQRLELAWKEKHQKRNDFLQARNGDHLLIPYECPLCVFRILKGRSPMAGSQSDCLLTDCIQRAILDAFWTRSTSTVKVYARQVRKMLEFSDIVGLEGPFRHTKLMPWRDHSGYEVTIAMLLFSRRKGKNLVDQMQFDTV